MVRRTMKSARVRMIAVVGCGALVVAGGLAVGAGGPPVAKAPNVSADPGVRYSDPGVPDLVDVPGAGVSLPSGTQELVNVAELRVARRHNGKVYLVGPGVKKGMICMVAAREGSKGDPVAVGCDPVADAQRKGIYLVSDDPAGMDGGVYLGSGVQGAVLNGQPVAVQGGIAPFQLPASGGTIEIERANGEPPISFTLRGN
jgi:hypothetical protein